MFCFFFARVTHFFERHPTVVHRWNFYCMYIYNTNCFSADSLGYPGIFNFFGMLKECFFFFFLLFVGLTISPSFVFLPNLELLGLQTEDPNGWGKVTVHVRRGQIIATTNRRLGIPPYVGLAREYPQKCRTQLRSRKIIGKNMPRKLYREKRLEASGCLNKNHTPETSTDENGILVAFFR